MDAVAVLVVVAPVVVVDVVVVAVVVVAMSSFARFSCHLPFSGCPVD